MNVIPKRLSESPLYRAFVRVLYPHGIPSAQGHYLIAFSGGADSTALLLLLHTLCRTQKHPPRLTALHVHHGIRGEEADHDAAFCETLCAEQGIPFVLCKADVPRIAEQRGLSIEECARDVRYECICDHLAAHPDITHVLTAHHGDDQTETVLFRLLRGTSLHGLAGIPAVRTLTVTAEHGTRTVPLIRPLLGFSRTQLCACLDAIGQTYVTDSTNAENDASRNLLRNVVLPAAGRINPDFTASLQHLADDAAEDETFFQASVSDFFSAHNITPADPIPKTALLQLPPALQRRILAAVYNAYRKTAPKAKPLTHVYLDAMRTALARNSRTSLPGGGIFSCEGTHCSIQTKQKSVPDTYRIPLTPGVVCTLPDGNACFYSLRDADSDEILQYLKNIYKFVISTHINSDTLSDSMFVRSRSSDNKEDVYLCGGSHKTVRDALSSHKVMREARPHLPLFCDGGGIVWVPFCGIRDSVNPRLHDGQTSDLYYFYNDNVIA